MRLSFLLPWRRLRPPADPIDTEHQRRETLREIGSALQSRREAEGLTMRQLASETRITTPVIEALERGWGDRLPERAYLASMLPQLEQRLALPKGTLDAVLPPASAPRRTSGRGLGRFTLGSIDVFTTWQGGVVYGLVMVVGLLMLNRQQHDLAVRNSLTIEPVRADLNSLQQPGTFQLPDEQIKALRPIQQALERKPQDWLPDPATLRPTGSGVLTVQLKKPRDLQLNSGGGDRLNLAATAGTITLKLALPVQLKIGPKPLGSERVVWNGEVLTPKDDDPGLYRVERSSAEAPSLERPQTEPLSP